MTTDQGNREQQATVTELGADSTVVPVVHERPPLQNDCVAAQTILQEILVGIWAGILAIEEIGIQDDFFELGGDSIMGTQIISQLRSMFGIDLPAVALFDAPTIEKLAQYMIEHEERPGLTERTAALLKQIEGMSEEEVMRNLHQR
jgi:acyl carrier protein